MAVCTPIPAILPHKYAYLMKLIYGKEVNLNPPLCLPAIQKSLRPCRPSTTRQQQMRGDRLTFPKSSLTDTDCCLTVVSSLILLLLLLQCAATMAGESGTVTTSPLSGTLSGSRSTLPDTPVSHG